MLYLPVQFIDISVAGFLAKGCSLSLNTWHYNVILSVLELDLVPEMKECYNLVQRHTLEISVVACIVWCDIGRRFGFSCRR